MFSNASKSSNVKASGILMLTSVALIILFAVMLLTQLLPRVIADSIMVIAWLVGPLLIFGVALSFTGHEVLGNIYAVLFLLAIIAAVIGGVFALRRKRWGLALAGAIGTLLTSPPLGIVALILLLSGRNEFRHESITHQISFDDKNHPEQEQKSPPTP